MKRESRQDFNEWDEEESGFSVRTVLAVLAAILCVLGLCVVLYFLIFRGEKEEPEKAEEVQVIADTEEEVVDKEELDYEDPQSTENLTSDETGAETAVSKILISEHAAETDEVTLGIDVSRFQGTIDWKSVADAGIDFAMIRVGYRTQSSGEIVEDSNARYNMQEASANGIKIGVYFFSTAVSEAEAVEEAQWAADIISQYPITYPVAYNCEGFGNPENRLYSLTKTERTDCAIAFLNEIYKQGYTPVFYASKNEMEEDLKWETSRIDKSFKIWVSQYPAAPYPQTATYEYQQRTQFTVNCYINL